MNGPTEFRHLGACDDLSRNTRLRRTFPPSRRKHVMKLKAILTAALLLAPTAALAAPGIVTESTGLRAGPGTGFPMVDRIPGGARVNIHGCLKGDAWCDISWSDDRGWISSAYLEYLY